MSTDVNTLMEMGFSENGAKRALNKTGYKGVQVAMDWLFAHEGDPDLNDPFEEPKGHTLSDPIQESTGSEAAAGEVHTENASGESTDKPTEETPGDVQTAKSLKCDDCGKVFRNMDEAEFHAAKSGHANFSESTEEKRALTAEEKAQQIAKLQEKMKQKRVEREDKEKQEKLDREKLRRIQGKDMVAAKAKFEEQEIKRLAEIRRKEKEEDKLARQKVKEQIERDKRERAAKFAKQAGGTPQQTTAPAAAASPPPAVDKPAAPKEYTNTRIQIRLPNGQALTQSFGAREQLAAVRLYVQMNRTDGDSSPFKLMMSFPKKVFTDEDMERPLSDLGLVPSAVLIVSKAT